MTHFVHIPVGCVVAGPLRQNSTLQHCTGVAHVLRCNSELRERFCHSSFEIELGFAGKITLWKM